MKRQELKEQRTANSKLFENKDHSFTREIYLDAVHFQDDDGEWKDMDDSLVEAVEEEVEAAAETDAEEQETATEGETAASEAASVPETAAEAETKISAPIFLNKKGRWKARFKKHTNTKDTMAINLGDSRLSWCLEGAAKVTAEREKEKITYPEILPGVDDVVYVRGEKVKENLILKAPGTQNAFTYLYRLKKLVPVQKGRCVAFLDENGDEAFLLSAPYMKDAKGERCGAIRVTLEEREKKDTCKVTFTPDEVWLAAEERCYPVTVDPVTTTSKKASEIQDAHVDSQYEEDNFGQSIILKTRGGDVIQRSFLKFSLPDMKTGDMVVNARMVMVSLAENGADRNLQVHRVTQDWDAATINWYNKPNYSDTIEDVCRYKGDAQKYVTLDITRLVKDWYENGKNYGVMIKDIYELSGYTEFLSADCHDGYQDMRPRIEISYVNYSGLEDCWTYHSQSVGRAGTVHVNDYNGNLIMEHATMATGGSRLPMGITHVYNTNDRTVDLGYGYGFRLNYHQTLKKMTIAGEEYYQHVDGTGTAHYFRKEKEKWVDETGRDMTLTVNATGEEPFVITDKEENALVFSAGGSLLKVRDKNGNTLTLGYTHGRIYKVTDGAGRSAVLTYLKDADGNFTTVDQIKSPSGQVKKFGYTDGNLTSITDIDGEKMTYTYNQRRLLTRITNVDGYSVVYDYRAMVPYRVRKITEYGGEEEGNILYLANGYNSTRFTDKKKNREIYRFDNFGNLLHIHDSFGHAASGKYCQDNKHVNRLENSTKLQDNVVQLLKDPIIQASKLGWEKLATADAEAVPDINTDTNHVKIGTRSLMITSTALTGYSYWAQKVLVVKGETYTFSMYVKASISEIADAGRCFLRVQYQDKDGVYQRCDSKALVQSTGDFVRLHVTFTVPKDSVSDTVKVYMFLHQTKGTMYGDMAQVEHGSTVSRCNLIDNGDFHLGTATGFTKTDYAEDYLVTCGKDINIPVENGIQITASSANIYKEPDGTSEVLAKAAKGVHIYSDGIHKSNDGSAWFHVRDGSGIWGYVKYAAAMPYVEGGNGKSTAAVGVKNAILRETASSTGTPVQEYIPIWTPLVIKKEEKDASGNIWYYVGMHMDQKHYVGYLPMEAVLRLCWNDAYGTMNAEAKLYAEPLVASIVTGSTLAAGKTVHIRGRLKKGTQVWNVIQSGAGFLYFAAKYMDEIVPPELERLYTGKAPEGVNGLDTHIFKFAGNPLKTKRITKTLDLPGKTGDTYMVNAWGYGNSLPVTDNEPTRSFGVEVVFVSADGKTKDTHVANFSPDILDWQFLSEICVAKNDYAKIEVSYIYRRNGNVAFFDGLSLFREEYGQTYTYDKDNNLVSVIDAQKKASKFEYNSTGDMTGVVDVKGSKFTYDYDNKHNMTKGTSAEGVVYTLKYDSAGNVTKSGCVEPDTPTVGTWLTRTFTEDKNHVASVTDAGNNKVLYDWDVKKDLLNSMTDARGNKITYGYDPCGRITSVSQAVTVDGVKTSVKNTYTYAKDKLTAISHNGFNYGFGYDAFGNMINASIGENKVAGYEYKAGNGNLLKMTYGNGDYISYTYDEQDRLKKTVYYNAAKKVKEDLNEYVYDSQGNLYQVTNYPSGKTYELDHDFLNRLVRIVDEGNNVSEFTYDVNNSMSSMVHRVKKSKVTTSFAYDKDGREIVVKWRYGKKRTTAYDSLGRVNSRTWDTTKPFATTYTYFNTDSTKRYSLPKTVKNGTKTLEYTYDANGNITSIKDGTGTSTFQYDELNQLIRENNHVQKKTLVYSYDLGGNLKTVEEYAFTIAEALPAAPVKTEEGSYDTEWKDKLVRWNGTAMTYDAVGNMLTKGGTTYTWREGRKLAGVNNGKNIQYFYDHTGRRTKKVVDGKETNFHLAGDLLMYQSCEGVNLWFSYDSASNLIAVTKTGEDYFYVRNAQNDVIGLIDADGNEVVKYEYDSWGNILSITGSLADSLGVWNPFRYRGYYYDDETGMYYLKSRYYDPRIRRFINADSLVNESLLGTNLFTYCENNPVNYVDPTGKFWERVWEFAKNVFYETGRVIEQWAPAYAACSGAAVADGPLLGGDIFGAIGYAALTGVAVCTGVYAVYQKSESQSSATAVEVDITKQNRYNYWTADLVEKKMVGGIPLTAEEAMFRVSQRYSVMCRNQEAAKYILFVNGYVNAVGPERHGNGYSHYHPTRNHMGYSSTHIWYFE